MDSFLGCFAGRAGNSYPAPPTTVLLPYALIPFRLYCGNFGAGVRLAIAMGCGLLVPNVQLVCFLVRWDRHWWVMGSLILALVMQCVLVVLGLSAFYSTYHVSRGALKFIGSLAYGLLLLGLFEAAYSPVPQRIRNNEVSAMHVLWNARLELNRNASQHDGTYPMALAGFGATDNPKCAFVPEFARITGSGNNYHFEYVGSNPLETFEGCTRFRSFAITARPIAFERTGVRSFFCDDSSRQIHATAENRPANGSDLVDPWMPFKGHRD